MISGNVPDLLNTVAKTGFLSAKPVMNLAYKEIAQVLPIVSSSQKLVDLGEAPMPTENIGRSVVKEFIEKTMDVKPKTFDTIIRISYNAVSDDQTGDLLRKARSAREKFDLHLDKMAFQLLNGGDGTSYGLCYDGQEFFDSDHVDAGASYTTQQDNEMTLALSLDNFTTALTAARKFRDDTGEFVTHAFDTLVVSPDLEYLASQICSNREAYDTASRESNPYAGDFRYIVNANLDTTAWYILATKLEVKPFIIVWREAPNLQASWFAPKEGNEGGMYYFKFMGRYNVVYGDWRLAIQGNT